MSEKQTFDPNQSPEKSKSVEEQQLWLVDTQAAIAENLEKHGIAEVVRKIATEKGHKLNDLSRLVIYKGWGDWMKHTPPPDRMRFGVQVISPNMDAYETNLRTGERTLMPNATSITYVPIIEFDREIEDQQMEVTPGFDKAQAMLVAEYGMGLWRAQHEGIVPNLDSDLTRIDPVG